jgi:hypothetical protein
MEELPKHRLSVNVALVPVFGSQFGGYGPLNEPPAPIDVVNFLGRLFAATAQSVSVVNVLIALVAGGADLPTMHPHPMAVGSGAMQELQYGLLVISVNFSRLEKTPDSAPGGGILMGPVAPADNRVRGFFVPKRNISPSDVVFQHGGGLRSEIKTDVGHFDDVGLLKGPPQVQKSSGNRSQRALGEVLHLSARHELSSHMHSETIQHIIGSPVLAGKQPNFTRPSDQGAQMTVNNGS